MTKEIVHISHYYTSPSKELIQALNKCFEIIKIALLISEIVNDRKQISQAIKEFVKEHKELPKGGEKKNGKNKLR